MTKIFPAEEAKECECEECECEDTPVTRAELDKYKRQTDHMINQILYAIEGLAGKVLAMEEKKPKIIQ